MEKYPIDFIITWVDGNDPLWQAEKAKYQAVKGDASVNRYREWDTLRYWFRGVEKFAPWVNKVFFVTWGHLPSWLNTEHPKLRIVKHTDYIPSEYLPTFSSRPIDMNFHRIEDLSEHFVYFNDDMFLLRPVQQADFFVNGSCARCNCAEGKRYKWGETGRRFSVYCYILRYRRNKQKF